jgi:hypothetical protein
VLFLSLPLYFVLSLGDQLQKTKVWRFSTFVGLYVDFLLPNERGRYIREQLDDAHKRRIKEARRAYTTFMKGRRQKYTEAQKTRDDKKTQNSMRKQNATKQQDIDEVTARLNSNRAGIGSAHRRAAMMRSVRQHKYQCFNPDHRIVC